jgi:diguanylate cyclase (GGDEF)-like protein
MVNSEKREGALKDRLDAYADWIRDFRRGKVTPRAPYDATEPLTRLAQELKLLSETIARREEELGRLSKIVRKVGRGLLVEDVLEKIFEGFSGLIPYDRIGCAFVSDGGTRLTAYWAHSKLGSLEIGKGYSQKLAGSSLQELFRTGEPRILNDLEDYLSAHPGSDATRRIVAEGGRSSLTCPLYVDGRPLGVLFFTSHEKNAYKDLHQAIFQKIAEEVAVVIHKSRLYEQLIENNQFLLRQAEQLKDEANRDSLTGILNRKAIMTTLEQQIRAAYAVEKMVGVIMVDIDYFKRVNDKLGHAAGDATLREFTRRLSTSLRENDYLGRYGGEEFLIIINDTTPEQLTQIAERFRSVIADTPFVIDENTLNITGSFGLTAVVPDTCPTEAVVAVADKALYAAKNSGRNKCILA